jgi:hypothetical protein
MRKRLAWFSLILALVVVVLTACSDTSTPAPLPPAPPPADGVNAAGLIGPEGGTVAIPGGAKIIVPPGALAKKTRITLESAPAVDVAGATPLGQTFLAGPEGQAFLVPVEIVVPFDATKIPVGSSVNDVKVRMAAHGTHDFVALETAPDLASGTAHAKTLHFTDFIAAIDPNPVHITTDPNLPLGTVDTAYVQTLGATGGTAPYTWSVSSGSAMPGGLVLSTDGTISGKPTVPSNFEFFLTVNDSAGHSVQQAFFLMVVPKTNPTPVLTSISPSSIPQGSPTTTIALVGSGFVPQSHVTWDGTALVTTFVSDTELSASISPAQLADAATHDVAVTSPAPGGGSSASQQFFVTPVVENPVPAIASVSPNLLPVTNVDTQIAIVGSNFIASTSAVIGVTGIPTFFVSDTQLTATIPAAYLAAAGTIDIGVFNPAPGGGFSATTVPVTIQALNPAPTLTTISPNTLVAGSGQFNIDLTGTGFVAGASAFFGVDRLATLVSSDTTAQATVPASLVNNVGSIAVTIVNPTPGGGASNALTFTVTAPGPVDAGGGVDAGGDASDAGDAADAQAQNPVPTLTSISPDNVVAGSGQLNIDLVGTGFVVGADVFFGGTRLATMVTSDTTAQATIPASVVAHATAAFITIVNKPPGGGTSNRLVFTVTAPPDAGSDAGPGGVTCTTEHVVTFGPPCTVSTTTENPTFTLIAEGPNPEAAITSNSSGLATLYNVAAGSSFPYFSGGPVTYTADNGWGTATRSGSNVTVNFNGARGSVAGCPVTPLWVVKCSGTTTLQ